MIILSECRLTWQAHFWSKDVTEEQLPPMFNVQVWDNDLFSKDDFIGKFL